MNNLTYDAIVQAGQNFSVCYHCGVLLQPDKAEKILLQKSDGFVTTCQDCVKHYCLYDRIIIRKALNGHVG